MSIEGEVVSNSANYMSNKNNANFLDVHNNFIRYQNVGTMIAAFVDLDTSVEMTARNTRSGLFQRDGHRGRSEARFATSENQRNSITVILTK